MQFMLFTSEYIIRRLTQSMYMYVCHGNPGRTEQSSSRTNRIGQLSFTIGTQTSADLLQPILHVYSVIWVQPDYSGHTQNMYILRIQKGIQTKTCSFWGDCCFGRRSIVVARPAPKEKRSSPVVQQLFGTCKLIIANTLLYIIMRD